MLEWEWQRLGARTCCVQGKKLLINGVPVIFKGVNRHEHDEHTGKYVSGVVLYRVPRMASDCMHDCLEWASDCMHECLEWHLIACMIAPECPPHQVRERGVHVGGRADDEEVQLQRDALLALSKRDALVRDLRDELAICVELAICDELAIWLGVPLSCAL